MLPDAEPDREPLTANQEFSTSEESRIDEEQVSEQGGSVCPAGGEEDAENTVSGSPEQEGASPQPPADPQPPATSPAPPKDRPCSGESSVGYLASSESTLQEAPPKKDPAAPKSPKTEIDPPEAKSSVRDDDTVKSKPKVAKFGGTAIFPGALNPLPAKPQFSPPKGLGAEGSAAAKSSVKFPVYRAPATPPSFGAVSGAAGLSPQPQSKKQKEDQDMLNEIMSDPQNWTWSLVGPYRKK